jgi:hypothetical protein
MIKITDFTEALEGGLLGGRNENTAVSWCSACCCIFIYLCLAYFIVPKALVGSRDCQHQLSMSGML